MDIQQDDHLTQDSDLPYASNTSQHHHRTSKIIDNRNSNSQSKVEKTHENYELGEAKTSADHQFATKDVEDNSKDKAQEERNTIDEGNRFESSNKEVLTRNAPLIAHAGVTGIKDNLAPIVGYAEEPLLPLHEACMPLSDVLFDLPFYVQLALDETPEVPLDDLTVDESAAIRLYTIKWEAPHPSLHTQLNYTLRTCSREELRPYFKYLKLFLTALIKLPCVQSAITVWRGVTKNLSSEFPPGCYKIWWAFSSCTTEITILQNSLYLGTSGERTFFSIGTINGRAIHNHSHAFTDYEILLLPGTLMIIQSQFSPSSGLHIVHLRQVIPTETLLEPPFEGAKIYPPKTALPWYKKPRTLLLLCITIAICIAGIIVGAVVGSRRPLSSSICHTRAPTLKANYIWSFDCSDAREEMTGLYNGTLMNHITFSSPDFSGQGKAIQLTRDLKNYVILHRSLNLTLNTSFAVSAWIFLTEYRPKPILTDCSNLTSICVSFIIKDLLVTVLIYKLDDENTIQSVDFGIHDYLCQSCWVYMAFTFDHRNGSLMFYFNGILTETHYLNITYTKHVSTNKVTNSYIGIDPRNATEYFNGPMDQLSITYYVKNASEILNEATLLFQYDFDSDDVRTDSGPNNIDARIQNVYRSIMNNDSTLSFNASDSYFQASGFALIESYNYEYSISFWLRLILQQPDKENSATAIFQLSTLINGLSNDLYTCVVSLHVYPNNGTMGYFFPKLYKTYALTNGSMKNNTWTHIGVTYDSPENYYFYVNGQLVEAIQDRRFSTLISSNSRLSVTIGGAYLNDSITNKPDNYDQMKFFARIPVFNYTQMYGDIDDIIFFARKLEPTEFVSLAASKRQYDTLN